MPLIIQEFVHKCDVRDSTPGYYYDAGSCEWQLFNPNKHECVYDEIKFCQYCGEELPNEQVIEEHYKRVEEFELHYIPQEYGMAQGEQDGN